MLEGLNVEEIKKYNESLRAHKERASKLKAEIEFNTTELGRLCTELTADLGIQVTPENLGTIYNDRVAKINDTLTTGTEILKRIAEEEIANAQVAATGIPDIGAGVIVTKQGPALGQGPAIIMPLGPMGTIGTPTQEQSSSQNVFSNLDGGQEL